MCWRLLLLLTISPIPLRLFPRLHRHRLSKFQRLHRLPHHHAAILLLLKMREKALSPSEKITATVIRIVHILYAATPIIMSNGLLDCVPCIVPPVCTNVGAVSPPKLIYAPVL